ncbi:MAG: hypothetical protein EA365_02255 [Gloeocapsa sp. DLM2.Bin57]|nr:MAG: hypothetical protein EA365_02255 [Gloeocapsa sp. DLM2.Bin57]
MKIEKPNQQPLTKEDLQNLDKLKALIEKCVSDGYLSQDEMKMIKDFIRADGKVTTEELELCQKLIWDKIQSGELQYDWTPKH